jgi:hypothetical protein
MSHCFDHFANNDFWNFTLNDIATAIIALINIALVVYIFVSQKRKESDDHRFILSHIDFNLKSEWFKTVILEPNISALHDFFIKIFNQFSQVDSNLTESERVNLINKVNSHCNKIEFRFISLLGCVDQNLENQCIEIVDNLRDALANRIISSNELNPDEYQSDITFSKRELITKLYNFIPRDLK